MNAKHFELVDLANEFLENYDMKLEIPIQFNSRLSRSLARYVYREANRKEVPVKIEVSVNLMKKYSKEVIFDVLKHELVHYALSAKGLPSKDGHPYFENELKKYGISPTNTISYIGKLYVYACKNCKMEIKRRRKLTEYSYCNCSEYPNLELIGEIEKKPNVV